VVSAGHRAKAGGRRFAVARTRGVPPLTATLVLSNGADQFTQLALLWFVVQRTGSPALLGAVVLCGGLPALVVAPLAGMLLDRADPARLVAADNLVRACCLAALPVLAWRGLLGVPVLLAVVAVTGALSPLTYAGSRVLVTRLVQPADLPAANGVLGLGDQLPFLLGPAVAGVLVGRLGGVTALLVPAAALLLAAALALRLTGTHRPGPATTRGRSGGRTGRLLRGGLGALWRVRPVRALLALSLAYYFAYGPLETALPVYVRGQLHAGAGTYGAMWSVFGAGAVVGLALVRPLARLRPGVVNGLGAVAWGVVVAPLVLVHSVPLAMVLLFTGAMVWAPYAAIELSVLQRMVPADRLGTVLGARRAVLIGAAPAGAALGSLLVAPGAAGLVIAASALACTLAGAACLCSPALRAVRPPPPRLPEDTRPAPALPGAGH
jgi:hypothetical protein